jgi:hypothetical protein
MYSCMSRRDASNKTFPSPFGSGQWKVGRPAASCDLLQTMSSEATTTTEHTGTSPGEALPVPRSASALLVKTSAHAAAVWQRIEPVLVRVGDWLNPILVKETRQALKSRYFLVVFVLLLALCWVATIGGVAYIGPSIYYGASGSALLWIYYIFLGVWLLLFVPYAAFRSLAAEREDNTYDLMSITTLKPRQIISGKLGSSVAQMAVYFSAVTPCLAFTYLLRGVDLPTIIVLLAYTFFGSLGLSMVGLLLATTTQNRVSQVFMSVGFIVLLLFACWSGLMAAYGAIFSGFGFRLLDSSEFWIFTAAMATFYTTSFALAFFAAAGMITFASENRSTPLRICMLVQQAAWVGWMGFAWIYSSFELAILLVMVTFAGMYWYVMGTLLTTERPDMSQRVKRQLPSTTLGRLYLSWLNPGPGSGYMFVIANATSLAMLCILGMIASSLSGQGVAGWPSATDLTFMLIIGWGYLVAYLGLGMLVVAALRRVAVVTMLASVLIHFLIVLAGSGIPAVVQMMSVELRSLDYSYVQITNPFWSLLHIANGGTSEGYVLVLIVPAAAACILLLNLRGVVRELRQVRIAAPPRVLADEAELHPPPEALPTNPWDEPA